MAIRQEEGAGPSVNRFRPGLPAQQGSQPGAAVGTLERVDTVLKVLGMVNAVSDFTQHPEVINGCTDLFVQVLGEAGRPARSAVGMASLPRNISVEVEAIVMVKGG